MANGLICTANCYSVHATVRRPNPTERIAGEMMADSGSCLNCSLPWRSWTLQAFAAVRRTIIRRQAQRAQPVEVARNRQVAGRLSLRIAKSSVDDRACGFVSCVLAIAYW